MVQEPSRLIVHVLELFLDRFIQCHPDLSIVLHSMDQVLKVHCQAIVLWICISQPGDINSTHLRAGPLHVWQIMQLVRLIMSCVSELGRDEGGGDGGGKVGGGGGGGRCKGRGDDAGDDGEEGETGDGSGGAAAGTERVVEREVWGVDEGLLRGIGGRG